MTAAIIDPVVLTGIYDWLTTYTAQAAGWRWLGLLDTSASEPVGGSYVRVELDGAVNVDGMGSWVENNAAITYSNMPATTIRWFALFDAPSGGNMRIQHQFDTDTAVAAGATFTIPVGDLRFMPLKGNPASSTQASVLERIAWFMAGVLDFPDPGVGWYPYGIDVDTDIVMGMQLPGVPAFEPFETTTPGQGSSTTRWFNYYPSAAGVDTTRADLVQRTDFIGLDPPILMGGAEFPAPLTTPAADSQVRIETGDLTVAVAAYDNGSQTVGLEVTFTIDGAYIATADVAVAGDHHAGIVANGSADFNQHRIPLIDLDDDPSVSGVLVDLSPAELEAVIRAGWQLGFLPQ